MEVQKLNTPNRVVLISNPLPAYEMGFVWPKFDYGHDLVHKCSTLNST